MTWMTQLCRYFYIPNYSVFTFLSHPEMLVSELGLIYIAMD